MKKPLRPHGLKRQGQSLSLEIPDQIGTTRPGPILDMTGITKSFPGVLANDRIDFTLDRGETHVLLGENGAGKSTLMNILYGLYQPDRGRIRLGGRDVHLTGPGEAIRRGIGMVHQHFMLAPVMTVVENIVIGREMTRFGPLLDMKKASRRVRELSEQYGLAVDPSKVVGSLPVGIRQRVEILKALYRNADLLILDEPTAVLTPEEADTLFQTMNALKRMGKSIIFITHKLNEVMRTADRITVLRRGRVVGRTNPGKTTESQLATLMVGRQIGPVVGARGSRPGKTILSVRNLTIMDEQDRITVNDVSFDIRAHEILGLAGIQGNGQTELAEALTGLSRCLRGTVTIDGQNVTNYSPRRGRMRQVGHIPEDRHGRGMVETYCLADNLVLNQYDRPPFSRYGFLKRSSILDHAKRMMKEYDIRAPGVLTNIGSLSGGNQQKAVAAREFTRSERLLIACQPTRGLDVGSAEYIHQRLLEKREQGLAVLLISTELDEILSLSDRVAVMFRGRIRATFDTAATTREEVGFQMAGGDRNREPW